MKLLHLSDLHLGKRVGEYSMLADQREMLKQILDILTDEQVDGVLIAGDVYDKTVPSEEAVQLLNWFFTSLAKRSVPTYVISGNHDSAVKLAFASELIDLSGIHIAPAYDGQVKPYVLQDAYGEVCLYLLPFLKPAHVRAAFPDQEILDYTDACRAAVAQMAPDKEKRNVLVAHQYVRGGIKSDSEEVSVGGLDQVDASVFADFDYVALGHLHGPQNIAGNIRYCGTMLKYSFSEEKQKKSVTIVELGPKGEVCVREILVKPRRDLRTIRGSFDELTAKGSDVQNGREDYLNVVLTDEEEIFDVMSRLREIYPNVMKLSYDNKRTQASEAVSAGEEMLRQDPLELFESFYKQQNNQPMSDVQRQFVSRLMTDIWEGEA